MVYKAADIVSAPVEAKFSLEEGDADMCGSKSTCKLKPIMYSSHLRLLRLPAHSPLEM